MLANDYFLKGGIFMENQIEKEIKPMVDCTTGEVSNYTLLNISDTTTDEFINAVNTMIIENQQKKDNQFKGYEKYLNKELLKDFIKNQGNYFYFLLYRKLLDNFPDANTMIFRFMYICTFGDYDGVLKYKKHNMTTQDLHEVLYLSKRISDDLIKELLNNNLLSFEDGIYRINPDYYIRGKIKDYTPDFTRVFNRGMQELYIKSNYKEHKMLSYFIPLLPYVNVRYNIVCFNPEEQDIKKIQPLNLKQVSELFNVDKSNSNRLKKKLLSITVRNVPLMGYFTRNFGNGLLKCFIVNPYVFYKASNINDLESIVKLFDISDNC